jgi:Protein of unknown function (DUF1592)/Protein of unknown function (DUF1588)/Protein of unknown function (DUF1587)/Protein of unknown function (DUF1585)/Protein of unknown function (DUF1595)/Planctomycete cytochrome C
MFLPRLLSLIFVAAVVARSATPAGVEDGVTKTSSELFETQVRPLLKEYCLTCHSTEKQKGELDLEQFVSLADVKRHPLVWKKVAEQLANEEMPPADKPQPKEPELARLTGWIDQTLTTLARERAGDPGPVVLRRLSNAEYTYTIRDLTGVASLDPAKEFPIDGAAGEGFMNTGQALVMSPSLVTKYLDAGKEIAEHAVLLPDGIEFVMGKSRRDRTDALLAQIRGIYGRYSDERGSSKVNLQGNLVETNSGGRLPLERYFGALLEERSALKTGVKTTVVIARERGLSAKYLEALWKMLESHEPSLVLDEIRARWRTAKVGDAAAITAVIESWQQALWRFNSVGHIGKVDGPKSWQEAVEPITTRQEMRLKIPPADVEGNVTLYLLTSDAGDGNAQDALVWDRPRFVAPGRPDLLLRDVRAVSRDFVQRRAVIFAQTAGALAAAAQAEATSKNNRLQLARENGVSGEALDAWFDYLGVGGDPVAPALDLLKQPIRSRGNFSFIQGWGEGDSPVILANASDQAVRIPGTMEPHSIAVHPSAQSQVGIGWRSPLAEIFRIEAAVNHAHIGCGNGIRWTLDLRRGQTRQVLAQGTLAPGKLAKIDPVESVAILPGDLISLLISSRGDSGCDLTAVNLTLTSAGFQPRIWNLAADVSGNILEGNPRMDRYDHAGVWCFYTEPENPTGAMERIIPARSLLAKWQTAPDAVEKSRLAHQIQSLLMSGPPIRVNPVGVADKTVSPALKEAEEARVNLYRELAAFGGPLFSERLINARVPLKSAKVSEKTFGLDRAQFGQAFPGGTPIDSASIAVQAPSLIEICVPAELIAGSEFITSGALDPKVGTEGSVQLQVLTTKPEYASGRLPSLVLETSASGLWTAGTRKPVYSAPIVVGENSRARARYADGFNAFREFFPAALCYQKIVPIDEVVTLTLFHREDEQLKRLMLDDAQGAQLDRLWSHLHFVSQDALMLVDVFEQLWQYATQDADPKAFEPLRQPINERAAEFRRLMIQSEPRHVEALLRFAERAYRRPLTSDEAKALRELYRTLREKELPHEEAVHLVLARVLVSPHFLYRGETPGPALAQVPLSDRELATRLSYFMTSSLPDEALLLAASTNQLHHPEVLAAHAQRLMKDDRVRRMAIEFACQWLHIRDFDTLDEKSDRHFPSFVGLRGAMYEESIRFFTDMFQGNRSVLSILDSDYTFLNEALAQHYGISDVKGEQWRRVEGIKAFSRGGVLGQATTLAKMSGASRTSPILRGNWIAEVILGEKLPRPPKDVPQLPQDEATESLTVRQLTQKHTSDPRCASCHAKIDAFGFSLEHFDSIGRWRERDLGGRTIDAKARVADGTQIDGLAGLRDYLVTKRRDAFLAQFNRKLLGYALGRSVMLSDEPLLEEMRAQLQANEYRVGYAIDSIVRSRQFREIRGRDTNYEQ